MGRTHATFLGCVLIIGAAVCCNRAPNDTNRGSAATVQDAKPYKELEFHVTKVSLIYEDSGATTVFHVEGRSKRVEYRLECRERKDSNNTCAHLEAGHDYRVDLYPDAGTVSFSDRPLLKGELEMPYIISSQDERE